MFSVQISTDVERAREFILALTRYAQLATGRRGREVMANVLERAHKQAFDNGGWQFLGGPEWRETGPYWVEKMNKAAYISPANKPLMWTKRGRDSVKGRVTADGVALSANEYLGKFQFGPFAFIERFPVDAGGHKLPDMERAVGFETQFIEIWMREVFRFDPEMVTWWEDELLEESGVGAVTR